MIEVPMVAGGQDFSMTTVLGANLSGKGGLDVIDGCWVSFASSSSFKLECDLILNGTLVLGGLLQNGKDYNYNIYTGSIM